MKALLWLLAVLWLAATAHSVFAAKVTYEQARSILAVAYGQYHGPRELFEDGPPPVFTATQEQLQEIYQCGREHCPAIHGTYNEETGEIHVWDGLDFSTAYATTVLAHEFIHYFQTRTRGRVMDMKLSKYGLCLEVVEREHQAYLIQMHLLMKAGEYMAAQTVRHTASRFRCGKPE